MFDVPLSCCSGSSLALPGKRSALQFNAITLVIHSVYKFERILKCTYLHQHKVRHQAAKDGGSHRRGDRGGGPWHDGRQPQAPAHAHVAPNEVEHNLRGMRLAASSNAMGYSTMHRDTASMMRGYITHVDQQLKPSQRNITHLMHQDHESTRIMKEVLFTVIEAPVHGHERDDCQQDCGAYRTCTPKLLSVKILRLKPYPTAM